MNLSMISFGGQHSFGRVSMPSAIITCTVCSFAMRKIFFQSVASLGKSAGSAGVPQSPALRSSRNCCCAKVVVSFILCVSALMLTVTKIVFFRKYSYICSVMIIDTLLLDKLTADAKASPRLRMNLDLRNSAADSSQRMLNAIEPGSVVPIHRHRGSSETLVVLRGRVVEEYYDSEGRLIESIVLTPIGDCHVADAPRNDVLDFAPDNDVPVTCALNIPAGQWHTLRALESGTVILEMKDGAYEPIGAEDVMDVFKRESLQGK